MITPSNGLPKIALIVVIVIVQPVIEKCLFQLAVAGGNSSNQMRQYCAALGELCRHKNTTTFALRIHLKQ